MEKKDTALKVLKKDIETGKVTNFHASLQESIFGDDEEIEEIYTPGTMADSTTKVSEPVTEEVEEKEEEPELPNVR